ncbi:MAG: hypothetical protein SFX73_17195 [Kofleriaceae bacterium]|nr:hypothetical protein [Kofleriaceae bacterium]
MATATNEERALITRLLHDDVLGDPGPAEILEVGPVWRATVFDTSRFAGRIVARFFDGLAGAEDLRDVAMETPSELGTLREASGVPMTKALEADLAKFRAAWDESGKDPETLVVRGALERVARVRAANGTVFFVGLDSKRVLTARPQALKDPTPILAVLLPLAMYGLPLLEIFLRLLR